VNVDPTGGWPRGPKLYQGGMLLAHRTTLVEGGVLAAMLTRSAGTRYSWSALASIESNLGHQQWSPGRLFDEVRRLAPETTDQAVLYGF